jgi:hypothetical protein
MPPESGEPRLKVTAPKTSKECREGGKNAEEMARTFE